MTAKRILKEARPLFWPWCAMALAGALPIVLPRQLFHPLHPVEALIVMGFIIGVPLLAAFPLGSEFEHQTISLLISQPIGRMKIWGEKLSASVVAVILATLVYSVALRATSYRPDGAEMAVAGAWVLATVASTTFWTLVARSTLGGFALTISVQAFILIALNIAYWLRGTGYSSSHAVTADPAATFVLLGYAGLMLWLGGRKLARFEPTKGMADDDLVTAGPDVLPSALVRWIRCRPTGAVVNLFRKEVRLLRPVWLLSSLTALGWACLTGLGLLHPRGLNRNFESVVASFSIISTLIIAILAGSLSLGEERTSGTHLWHLSLPVSARRQWAIKLCMALFAGFAGVWLLPTLIAGRSLFASRPDLEPLGLVVVLLLSLTAFWCACVVAGTVRSAVLVLPVMTAFYFAGEFGKWAGPALTAFFLSRFDPFANVKFADAVSRLGSNALFRLIDAGSSNGPFGVQLGFVLPTAIFVPTVLYAVIQSYRLFRTQIQGRTLLVIKSLLPLALTALLCSFSLFSLNIFVFRAQHPKLAVLFETTRAIQKLQLGAAKLDAAHPLQLTVEDLAKAYPLSKSTRRILGNGHITLSLDEPPHLGHFGCAENLPQRGLSALRYSWYSAIVSLADGSRFFVDFEPVGYTISAGFCK